MVAPYEMAFDLAPRDRIWVCVYVQNLFYVHTQG